MYCILNSPSDNDSLYGNQLTDACIPPLTATLVHPGCKLTVLTYALIIFSTTTNLPSNDSLGNNQFTDGCVPFLYDALKHPNCGLQML